MAACNRGNSHFSVDQSVLRWEAGNPTERWQDKRGSPVVVQAIDMAWLLACHSVGTRAAFENLHRDFNAVSGTLRLVPQSAGPP